MGAIRGAKEYRKWKKGNKLTRKEAMLAHCFDCNGGMESRVGCSCGDSCPMFEYAPYKAKTPTLTD